MNKILSFDVNAKEATSVDTVSPLVTIINEVIEAIAAIPGFSYVDEDWGQLDYYSQHPPVKWPCALVDTSEVNYEDISRRKQKAIGFATVKVANLKTGNTSHRAPVAHKDRAHSVLELAEDVHSILKKKLTRTRMLRSRREDGIQEYLITYSFGLLDV